MSKTGVVSSHQSLGVHLYSVTIPVSSALTISTSDQGISTLLAKNAYTHPPSVVMDEGLVVAMMTSSSGVTVARYPSDFIAPTNL